MANKTINDFDLISLLASGDFVLVWDISLNETYKTSLLQISNYVSSNNNDIVSNTAHRGATSGNPHSVSKSDVGLGSVTDDAQLKASQLQTAITDDDTKVPSSGAVVDYVSGLGGGDMLKTTYDTNDNGIVDTSDALITHAASTGSDHSYIDQDVTSGSSPIFDGSNINGVDAANVVVDASGFSTNLSSTDTDVQTALNTIDIMTTGSGGTSTPYEQSFTATSSQTNFTLTNTPGAAWVWINGAAQDPTTWSISGSDIVLDAGATLNDDVKIYYFTDVSISSTDPIYNSVGVNSNGKIYLEGASSDTYFSYNSTTSKVELFVNGSKKAEWG